jgi:orotate phosphoribosyltransferase
MPTSSSAERLRLREIIRENSLKTDRSYVLSSGEKSGYYFDMKPTTFSSEGIVLISKIIYDLVEWKPGMYVGGLAVGAVPIVSALVFHSAPRVPVKGFYVREEIKNHGTQKLIEGVVERGAEVIIIDDVTTKGSSAMKAVEAVRQLNCRVLKVITVVDRLEGASEAFRSEGLELVPLFTTKDFMN